MTMRICVKICGGRLGRHGRLLLRLRARAYGRHTPKSEDRGGGGHHQERPLPRELPMRSHLPAGPIRLADRRRRHSAASACDVLHITTRASARSVRARPCCARRRQYWCRSALDTGDGSAGDAAVRQTVRNGVRHEFVSKIDTSDGRICSLSWNFDAPPHSRPGHQRAALALFLVIAGAPRLRARRIARTLRKSTLRDVRRTPPTQMR